MADEINIKKLEKISTFFKNNKHFFLLIAFLLLTILLGNEYLTLRKNIELLPTTNCVITESNVDKINNNIGLKISSPTVIDHGGIYLAAGPGGDAKVEFNNVQNGDFRGSTNVVVGGKGGDQINNSVSTKGVYTTNCVTTITTLNEKPFGELITLFGTILTGLVSLSQIYEFVKKRKEKKIS